MAVVLIAEDDESSRTLLAWQLVRAGYEVIAASDGADAVAKCLSFGPDLVLMDLSMPEMDGIEAWRAVLEMTETPPPVIALTGVLINDVRLACAELGFAAYIQKPYDFATLLRRISDLAPSALAA